MFLACLDHSLSAMLKIDEKKENIVSSFTEPNQFVLQKGRENAIHLEYFRHMSI